MDINEHLAVNVMGWERDGVSWLDPKNVDWWISSRAWCPNEQSEQAIMCAERMRRDGWNVDIAFIPNSNPEIVSYECEMTEFTDEGMTACEIGQSDKSPSEAISAAIAKATGWEE